MFRQLRLLGLVLCFSLPSLLSQGQTIAGSDAARSIRANGGGASGSSFVFTNEDAELLRIGRLTSGIASSNIVAIYSFRMPDLGAVTNPFATANLEFQFSGFTSRNFPAYNVDLYGIDLRSINESVVTDFFVGPGPDFRGTTLTLQEDILTPASTVVRISSANIAGYLNNHYNNGAGVGQFAYFRLSPDYSDTSIVAGNNDGYFVFSADGPAALAPTIEFTVAAPVLVGDVNMDGGINFLDISPFIAILSMGDFKNEADIDRNETVNFQDIAPFILLLSGS